MAAFAIGAAVFLGIIVSMPFTGGSMNPADHLALQLLLENTETFGFTLLAQLLAQLLAHILVIYLRLVKGNLL